MTIILNILTLLGSIGLFLYGMKLMSESLQKVAGDSMRHMLSAMTSNKFRALFTGIVLTAILQLSSATSVLAVSFVNAGIITLTGSVSFIIGANIGTTLKTWIILLLGFSYNISVIYLPLIAIALPFIFFRNRQNSLWGELLIGFAFVFMGLDFLKNFFPELHHNVELLNWLAGFSNLGWISILVFLMFGVVFTMLIQSSSAMLALTLVLTSQGLINFENSAAIVLGSNLGTTITANLAAMFCNVEAKTAARSHFVFNFFGLIWALTLLPFYLKGISFAIENFGFDSPYTNISSIPIALALLHTSFNIITALLLLKFTPQLISVSRFLVLRTSPIGKNNSSMKHIHDPILSTSELSIVQARTEIYHYAQQMLPMFQLIPKLLMEKDDLLYNQILNSIEIKENEFDDKEIEISNYLTHIAQANLSEDGTLAIREMFAVIDNIESVADSCYQISKTIQTKNELKVWFTQENRNQLSRVFELVEDILQETLLNLSVSVKDVDAKLAFELEHQMNVLRDELRDQHLENLSNNEYSYQTGLYYSGIFLQCEKLCDYAINITESVVKMKPRLHAKR